MTWTSRWTASMHRSVPQTDSAEAGAASCSCRIAGIIDGNIFHEDTVVLGTSALVIGDVFGGDVFVYGAVTGTVVAQGLVRLYPGASVGCEIVAAEVDIDPRACVPPAFLRTRPAVRVGRRASTDVADPSATSTARHGNRKQITEWPRFVG